MREFFPFLLITTLACAGILILKGQSRPPTTKPLDYDQYRARYSDPRFDPVGATEILVLNSQDREEFDTWWRFKISEANLGVLVSNLSVHQQGPTDLTWEKGNLPPERWRNDSKLPIWWAEPEFNPDGKSIHWCYPDRTDGRHQGWFVTFDQATSLARIWNWSYPASADKCQPAKKDEQ